MLKKKPKERTPQDLIAFSRIIQSTEFAEKLKIDLTDEIDITTLLSFCSLSMEDELYEAGKIVFREEENVNKLYLLLKGKMTEYKITEQVKEYTGLEYYQFLKQVRNNDHCLFERTMKANSKVYTLRREDDLDVIDEIFFNVKYLNLLTAKPSREEIEGFLISFSKNPKDFGVETIGESEEEREAFYSKQKSDSDYIYDYYRKYFNPSKKKISAFNYDPVQCLTIGQFFSSQNKQVALVKTEEDCLLLVLNLTLYNEQLLNEKAKIKEREFAFLHDSFFFNPIRKSIFEKKYYKEFVPAEYHRNYILFKENDEPKELIIISEGIVELTINQRSIIELQNISKSLQQLDQLISIGEHKMNLENPPKNYIKSLMEKRKYNILKLANKEILGEWEFFFGVRNLFTAKVMSEKAKIYQLSYGKFMQLYEEDSILFRSLQEASRLKVQSIVKRLNEIVNNCMSRIDKEYSQISRFNNQEKKPEASRINVRVNHHFLMNHDEFKHRSITSPIKIISQQDREKIPSIDKSSKDRGTSSITDNKRASSEERHNFCTNEEIQIKNLKEQINSIENPHTSPQHIRSLSPISRINILPIITNRVHNTDTNQYDMNTLPHKAPYMLPILNKMKASFDKKSKSQHHRKKENKLHSEEIVEQITERKRFLKPNKSEIVVAVKEFYRKMNKNKCLPSKKRRSSVDD